MLNKQYTNMLQEKDVIFEIFQYATERAKVVGAENIYDFSLGNPSVPAPSIVNETIVQKVKTLDPLALHGYSPSFGIMETREKIAASLNKKYGSAYKASNIFMAIGAAGALAHALRAVTNPGDEIITFAPCFSEYKPYTAGAGLKLTIIPADIDTFQINFAAFEAQLNENVSAVLINSPNNPSGIVYSTETIEKLSSILTAKSKEFHHPIYLISDEPYRDIIFEGVDAPYIANYYKNTLTCYSFSKSISLPGERIGYLVMPDELDGAKDIIAAAAVANRILGYVNAPSLFQRVIAKCLDAKADLEYYNRNRETLYNGLQKAGLTCIKPEGAFYLFVISPIADEKEFCQKAKEYHLLIVPGSSFACPGYVRLAYCVSYETIVNALPKFEELMKNYK